MSTRFTAGAAFVAAVLMTWLAAVPLVAQNTGRIAGTVTTETGSPVNGASIVVSGTRWSGVTDHRGSYLISGVPAGTYELRIGSLGFRDQVVSVAVTAGATASADVRLEGRAIALGGVVVSASRQVQRVTDAPATVTRIEAEAIEHSVGNTWVGALKQVKGIDFIQVGMTSVALNARGFNSSFNNRMLMMEDGRIAVLPENGLPVGQFTASPKIDLAGIEVLVGPGAALYGADASSGVVTLQSKDPRRFPGTTLEATGGSREYMNVQARHAGLVGSSWGYKLAGEYQQANDWDNYLTYTIAGVPDRGTVPVREDEIPGNSIDWTAKVMRATGSVVHYAGDNRLEFSAGGSETDGVGQTNVGRNQLRGWQYNFVQAQYSTPRVYLNAYRTQSKSGESFAINRYADAYARNPTLSPDSLRMLSDWPSNGRLYAAEAQHNFRLPQLLNTTVTWGGQVRRDVVSSERQWLTDRLTGKDLEIDQKGVYAQIETPVLPQMNVVVAGRYDQHENYDAQFSPKLGVVLKPAPAHALRLTLNRAFKSPTTLQTNFHIPDWTAVVAIYGNTEGFTVRDAGGGVVAEYAPLQPEENTTLEIGYKGVVAQRLFLDGAYYRSRYEHFMSPLVIISNPYTAAPTFAHDASGQRIVNHTGIPPVTLIYYNLGRADLHGIDAGANFYALSKLTLSGTFSWLKVQDVEVPAGREEATATNAPNTKWTFGANLMDVAGPAGGLLSAGTTLRHVTSHYFRSGINMGVIPTFSTLDLSAGYRLPRFNTSISLGVNNLFTCSQDQDVPLAYADALRTTPTNKERQCGFNMKHVEMINMPAIGTMVFVGARYHLPR